jgi:hypothetical protein
MRHLSQNHHPAKKTYLRAIAARIPSKCRPYLRAHAAQITLLEGFRQREYFLGRLIFTRGASRHNVRGLGELVSNGMVYFGNFVDKMRNLY